MNVRLCVCAVLAAVLLTPASAGAAATFTVRGAGFGHGVGMSQYGAYGYAQHGWGYKQILLHYFKGTTLGPAPVTTMRVLVAEKQKAVAIASSAPFKVRDGVGALHTLNALSISVGLIRRPRSASKLEKFTYSGETPLTWTLSIDLSRYVIRPRPCESAITAPMYSLS